jgi:Circularly permutated YpsA SLOG family
MARLGVVGKAICIISGGQTGVDRACLAWAIWRGVQHAGWCPKAEAEDCLGGYLRLGVVDYSF